jgi:hypothetical protein
MKVNWTGCGSKRSWPILRCYDDICLEGVKMSIKTSVRIEEYLLLGYDVM